MSVSARISRVGNRVSPCFLLFALVACGGGHGATVGATPATATDAAAASPDGAAPTTQGFADPPASAVRLELTLDPFDLDPGGEIYKCQNFQNPIGKDVAVIQSQSVMSRGSHHLAVFRIDQNADGSLEDCSGLEFHATIHAAQTPVARLQYPEGVGGFLAGANGIRLNAHYLNATNAVIHAQVSVALDYVDLNQVTYTAAQIYLNDSKIDIPPGQGTAGGTMALPASVSGVKLLSAQSHMHRRGTAFLATLEGGATLYQTTEWNAPPMTKYDPPMALADGASITWRCDYYNDTASDLTFGESANTNEMCVLTGFYYPAPAGQMIVGDTSGGSTASLYK